MTQKDICTYLEKATDDITLQEYGHFMYSNIRDSLQTRINNFKMRAENKLKEEDKKKEG